MSSGVCISPPVDVSKSRQALRLKKDRLCLTEHRNAPVDFKQIEPQQLIYIPTEGSDFSGFLIFLSSFNSNDQIRASRPDEWELGGKRKMWEGIRCVR